MGRDRRARAASTGGNGFNPRAPCGARPPLSVFTSVLYKFQSTRPVWGATGFFRRRRLEGIVSIHAPRVGRDAHGREWPCALSSFNPRAPCGARLTGGTRTSTAPTVSIHAPRVGRDYHDVSQRGVYSTFQSTRPVWGATKKDPARAARMMFQSTRPVWGATREENKELWAEMFQSTRPVWGATCKSAFVNQWGAVSIHAPRVGRDKRDFVITADLQVSIHAPRVGRDGNWSHDFPLLPRIYGHSPPQIRFSRHLRPTPLLRHDSRTYIFTFCFLFTSPSHSVMNAQMMIAASKS